MRGIFIQVQPTVPGVPALFITTSSPLPSATVGSPYSLTFTASGGVPPYAWSVVSDTPDTGGWFSLSSGGVGSGTPSIAETETIVVKCTDARTPTADSVQNTFSLTVNAASGAFAPPYPRLGTYYNGTQAYGGGTGGANLAAVNYLAAFNVNVLAINPGNSTSSGASAYGGSYHAFVAEIKALSPTGVLNLQFCNSQFWYSQYSTFPNDQTAQLAALQAFPNWNAWTNANSQGLPVQANGTSAGQVTYSGNGPQTNQTVGNGSLASPQSQLLNGGLTWEQAFWQQMWKYFIAGTGGAPSTEVATNLDGVYHDNYVTVPAVAYDYNFSGSATSPGNAAFDQSHRYGLARGTQWLLNNTTGGAPNGSIYTMGNLNTWVPDYGYDAPTGMTGNLHGGMYETALGDSYSPNTNSGFGGPSTNPSFFGSYTYMMSAGVLQAPQLLCIEHDNMTATGTDGIQTTSYAAMRYGLTATLLLNGYYTPKQEGGVSLGTIFFDEFAVNSSGVAMSWNGSISSVAAGRGYMGQPTSAWGTVSGSGAYQVISGLYVRMFYNATTGLTWVAICAPTGAGGPSGGPFTISATSLHAGSAGFKMISGTQAPSINNGSTVSSITIPTGYDGRIAMLL
jgi:hypothetical protein